MNQYYEKEDYMVGVCSDGQEFLFDKDEYEKISTWNWMHHHDSIDGAKGKQRISLAKLITGHQGRQPVLMRQKGFDFRRSNLYDKNCYTDMGDYYKVDTISGQDFFY